MASLADLRTFFAQPPPRQVPASVRTHLLSGARRWQWVMAAATVACAIGFLIFFPWRLADTLQVDFDGQSGYGGKKQGRLGEAISETHPDRCGDYYEYS